MNNIDIEWKDIPGYQGLYQINNEGTIRSLFRYKKILKPMNAKDGYSQVNLFLHGKSKTYPIHRLMMYAFKGVSNLQVNHINGNKKDNNILNLEYVTASENILHSYRKLGRNAPFQGKKGILHNCSIEVDQYSDDGVFIKRWGSMADINRELGIGHISCCCKGKRKLAGGFIWKYSNYDKQ